MIIVLIILLIFFTSTELFLISCAVVFETNTRYKNTKYMNKAKLFRYKYSGGKEKHASQDIPTHTFYCNYPPLTDSVTAELLKHKWRQVNKPQNVELLIISPHIKENKIFNKYVVSINHRGINDILTNKYLLTKHFQDYSWLPRSMAVLATDKVPYPDWGERLIVKPSIGFKGEGIFIVDNQEELNNALDTIYVNNKHRASSNDRALQCVISKYITNPMLFNKNKGHMRVYVLIYADRHGLKRMYLLNQAEILTSDIEYTDDLTHIKAHNVHYTDDEHLFYYPDDYTKYADATNAQQQLVNICKDLAERAKDDIIPYEEHKEFHEILGLDILPDSDGKLWLLEVNYKVGLTGVSEKIYQPLGRALANIIVDEIDDDCTRIM